MADLVYAGIDEAGYGPMLGPLCIGLAVFRVPHWAPDLEPRAAPGEAPDLWEALGGALCKAVKDPRRRIAIADSKKLKGANSLKRVHPLRHLERGVLAMLGARGDRTPTDSSLMRILGASLGDAPWFGGEPLGLPVGADPQELALDIARLSAAMRSAGVELLDARCRVIDAPGFNRAVRETGSKGALTLASARDAIARVIKVGGGSANEPDAEEPPIIRIVGDRLGGRLDYAPMLEHAIGRRITCTHRCEAGARYEAMGGRIGVQFRSEAEDRHMPVALASMLAKLTRELAMIRFNRYWSSRSPTLRPTAGYATDARRWLREASPVLNARERADLVRIA